MGRTEPFFPTFPIFRFKVGDRCTQESNPFFVSQCSALKVPEDDDPHLSGLDLVSPVAQGVA